MMTVADHPHRARKYRCDQHNENENSPDSVPVGHLGNALCKLLRIIVDEKILSYAYNYLGGARNWHLFSMPYSDLTGDFIALSRQP